MKKLYVKNLPYSANEEDLEDHLVDHGFDLSEIIFVKILRDYETKKSKGSAFVEMTTKEACERVISLLNAKEFLGRPVYFEHALSRPNQSRFDNRNSSKGRQDFGNKGQPEMTMHRNDGYPEFSREKSSREQRRFENRKRNFN